MLEVSGHQLFSECFTHFVSEPHAFKGIKRNMMVAPVLSQHCLRCDTVLLEKPEGR